MVLNLNTHGCTSHISQICKRDYGFQAMQGCNDCVFDCHGNLWITAPAGSIAPAAYKRSMEVRIIVQFTFFLYMTCPNTLQKMVNRKKQSNLVINVCHRKLLVWRVVWKKLLSDVCMETEMSCGGTLKGKKLLLGPFEIFSNCMYIAMALITCCLIWNYPCWTIFHDWCLCWRISWLPTLKGCLFIAKN